MTDVCTFAVRNFSKVTIEQLRFWHSSTPPEPAILGSAPFLTGERLGPGAPVTGSVARSSGTPDFWVAQLRYAGDDRVYVIAGEGDSPWREFSVADNSVLIFEFERHLPGESVQTDGNIYYSNAKVAPADHFRVLDARLLTAAAPEWAAIEQIAGAPSR